MLPIAIDFDSLPWESPLPSARFKVYREGAKQIRLLEFSSEFVEPVWCEKGHFGVVLEGTLEVDFNGRVVVYPQGSGIFISAGAAAAHKARPLRQLYAWFSLKMFRPNQLPMSVCGFLFARHRASGVTMTPNPSLQRTWRIKQRQAPELVSPMNEYAHD